MLRVIFVFVVVFRFVFSFVRFASVGSFIIFARTHSQSLPNKIYKVILLAVAKRMLR